MPTDTILVKHLLETMELNRSLSTALQAEIAQNSVFRTEYKAQLEDLKMVVRGTNGGESIIVRLVKLEERLGTLSDKWDTHISNNKENKNKIIDFASHNIIAIVVGVVTVLWQAAQYMVNKTK